MSDRLDEDGHTWRTCIGGVASQSSPFSDCDREFLVPKRDPDRVRCEECLRFAGEPRIDRRSSEERPLAVAETACSVCHQTFIPVDEDGRCSPCRATAHIQSDQVSEKLLSVLEVDERPDPQDREGVPLFRRLDKTSNLEYAAELAADMETGYYIPEGQKEPWPAKTFVMREIFRRMGYSKWFISGSRRPMWWPDGGTTAFKGYVEWKKRQRALMGQVTFDQVKPYIEALTFMGFAEIARRLQLQPDKIPFRDLTQFALRSIEMTKSANPFAGESISKNGSDAFSRMNDALDGVSDQTARRAIAGLLDAVMVEARSRMRESAELPSKSA